MKVCHSSCGNWAATKATYEFWKSPRLKPNDIRLAHQKSTVERVKAHSIALAIQDTTDLNFTHHPTKQGIGPISSQATVLGLKVHLLIRGTHNRRVNYEDGEPGVKTIWRGWQRLQDIAATWQLLHSHPGTGAQLE